MLHLHVCQYEHRKTAFAVSSSRHFTLARWQVARPLQLDCLSKLNPIIHVPRAYSFTYLSSLVIFTATSSSSIDTILPTRDWKHASSRGRSASKDGRYFETINESTIAVPFSLKPSFVAQENQYRHARQDYDHIGWSVNLCVQSNFDAWQYCAKWQQMSHFFHRYCFFTGPLTHHVQSLDMKRHPNFLRTFNSFLFHTLSSACLVWCFSHPWLYNDNDSRINSIYNYCFTKATRAASHTPSNSL